MDGYLLSILGGAWLTVCVALCSLSVSVVLGLLGAAAKLSGRRPLVWVATVYTTVIRGIPDLVLMLLVFYGGQSAVNQLAERIGYGGNIDVNPFVAGVLTIGFIYGAYLTETFRGAILAIPRGQAEAGLAFGMTPSMVLMRLIVPQMLRLALPGLTNNWLVLVKATALVSIIGLGDMMYRAKQASGATRSAFLYFLLAALVYLAITTFSLVGLSALEKRFSLGVRRVDF
ncbi:MAG: ABC transporter permease [Burkholderiaceae bacterium]|jgi:arginine/ornithine transport system permease protein